MKWLKPILNAFKNLLLLGQATICWKYYNPVPSLTEMH